MSKIMMSNHLTGGPPATPPHVQYEYPLKHSEPLLMALMERHWEWPWSESRAESITRTDSVPCAMCVTLQDTRANRPNVRNLTRHSRSYRRHLCEGAIRVGCGYATRHISQTFTVHVWLPRSARHTAGPGRHDRMVAARMATRTVARMVARMVARVAQQSTS